jgi:hypothetical protein
MSAGRNWSLAFFRLWLGLSVVWIAGWALTAGWEYFEDDPSSREPETVLLVLVLPVAVLAVGLFIRWVVRGLKEPVTD